MITIDKHEGIQVIRLNRPEKKNAFTQDMYHGLAQALSDDSDDIRCHVLLGQPGIFTAGNDIPDFLSAAFASKEDVKVTGFLEVIPHSTRPIVAGIDGPAIGVGTTMLFHCDMVFASPQAYFKTPFVDLGIVPEAGSSMLAPLRMGHQRAFELLCMGKAFSAEEAREAGFVNEVVPEEELEKRVMETAAQIAAKPIEAMKLSRDLMRASYPGLEDRIQQEMDIFVERLSSAEAKAAFMKFMAKAN